MSGEIRWNGGCASVNQPKLNTKFSCTINVALCNIISIEFMLLHSPIVHNKNWLKKAGPQRDVNPLNPSKTSKHSYANVNFDLLFMFYMQLRQSPG